MFSVSSLLLDDALKPATLLSSPAARQTINAWQFWGYKCLYAPLGTPMPQVTATSHHPMYLISLVGILPADDGSDAVYRLQWFPESCSGGRTSLGEAPLVAMSATTQVASYSLACQGFHSTWGIISSPIFSLRSLSFKLTSHFFSHYPYKSSQEACISCCSALVPTESYRKTLFWCIFRLK